MSQVVCRGASFHDEGRFLLAKAVPGRPDGLHVSFRVPELKGTGGLTTGRYLLVMGIRLTLAAEDRLVDA